MGVIVNAVNASVFLLLNAVVKDSALSGGPIGFVGLVCPRLGRLIVGPDQRRLLPVATALGAGLLCVADAASRWLAQSRVETVLPVGC